MIVRSLKTTLMALFGGLWLAPAAWPTPLLSEGFDNVSTLAGWVQTNNSSPIGATGWFQGNDGVFPSHEGAPGAYIAANFENTGSGGTISNWLLTPVLSLVDGVTLSFWTRTEAQAEEGSSFPDRLEVRVSTSGASMNVGGTAASLGDFGVLLLTINPMLSPGGYPEGWTQFSLALSGIPVPTDGRFAFRYFVDDSGPEGSNGNYIGIDSVSVAPIPEPGTLLLVASGSLALLRRRCRVR